MAANFEEKDAVVLRWQTSGIWFIRLPFKFCACIFQLLFFFHQIFYLLK